jgi:hypothetical protein
MGCSSRAAYGIGVPVGKHHASPVHSKRVGDRTTDALGGSRDERGAPGHIDLHALSPKRWCLPAGGPEGSPGLL